MKIGNTRLTASLINDTSLNNHHGCAIVTDKICTLCASHGILIKTMVPLRKNWREDKYIAGIRSSDLVIVNGEGSVHHSREFAKDMLRIAEYCKEHNIPVFFINGVYQANDSETDALMQKFNRVWVRESFSQKALAQSGIEAKLVPDIVISLKPRPAKIKDVAIDVLYTDSVKRDVTQNLFAGALKHYGGRTEFVTLRKTEKHVPINGVRSLISRIMKMRSRNVAGAVICNPGIAGYCETLDDLLTVISSSSLVVAGRFHMVCLCLTLEVPFLAVRSNSHKVEGLLEDIGLTDRLLKNSTPTISELQSARAWKEGEIFKLRHWLDQSRADIDNMFSVIYAMARPI